MSRGTRAETDSRALTHLLRPLCRDLALVLVVRDRGRIEHGVQPVVVLSEPPSSGVSRRDGEVCQERVREAGRRRGGVPSVRELSEEGRMSERAGEGEACGLYEGLTRRLL